MNSFKYIIFFLFHLQIATAQRSLDTLINVEKKFAASSVLSGVKEAFLQNADSNSIVFVKEKAENAIEVWSKRANQPWILNWQPEYAAINFDGDLGFTTGPYTIQKNSIHDSIIAAGNYLTIWKKTKNQSWKFLIDDGIDTKTKKYVVTTHHLNFHTQKDVAESQVDSFSIESDFIRSVTKNKKQAYDKYLSPHSLVYRDGFLVAATAKNRNILIDSTPAELSYSSFFSGSSSGSDMVYVYGTIKKSNQYFHYLRVWVKERGLWKIAAEVIHY